MAPFANCGGSHPPGSRGAPRVCVCAGHLGRGWTSGPSPRGRGAGVAGCSRASQGRLGGAAPGAGRAEVGAGRGGGEVISAIGRQHFESPGGRIESDRSARGGCGCWRRRAAGGGSARRVSARRGPGVSAAVPGRAPWDPQARGSGGGGRAPREGGAGVEAGGGYPEATCEPPAPGSCAARSPRPRLPPRPRLGRGRDLCTPSPEPLVSSCF